GRRPRGAAAPRARPPGVPCHCGPGGPPPTRTGADMGVQLRVDPVACAGHGACAELLPELISRDEWGYPIVAGQPVPRGLRREARPAVPRRPAPAPAPPPGAGGAPLPPRSARTAAG